MGHLDRRSFLNVAAAAATTAATAGAAARASSRVETPAAPAGAAKLRLGAPLGVPGGDPEALARAHRAKGYRAAYCPDLRLEDREKIRATVDAFARHDVVIAEVGRWVNLLDPDAEARRKNLQTVSDGLALAEAVGARCCVDIAGSFSTTSWFGPHPDNLSPRFFDAAVENARRIVDAVKPTRTTFCYEMMALVAARQPRRVPEAAEGGRPQGLRGAPRPVQPRQLACALLRSSDLIRECYAQARPADRERAREGPRVGRRDGRALPRGAPRPGLDRPRRAAGEHAPPRERTRRSCSSTCPARRSTTPRTSGCSQWRARRASLRLSLRLAVLATARTRSPR